MTIFNNVKPARFIIPLLEVNVVGLGGYRIELNVNSYDELNSDHFKLTNIFSKSQSVKDSIVVVVAAAAALTVVADDTQVGSSGAETRTT